jgi:hypothetical protein
MEDAKMYKKYVLDSNATMMEFNQLGILQFLSGKKENKYINQLMKIW